MARLARVVAPGFPHHVTQRGNRCQQTFFCEDDHRSYRSLPAEWHRRTVVDIRACCLMGKRSERPLGFEAKTPWGSGFGNFTLNQGF